MIIKARHNWIVYPFFKFYALFRTRRNFNSITVNGDFQDKNLPLLVISNHFSWWDGFWAMYLNLTRFHRKFHFMMLEEQLRKFSFFINAGGYSVKKGSRSVIESINYTIELLSAKENLVLLYPQGRLTSIYDQEIRFEKGIERILKATYGKVQVVFVANLIDYLSEEKLSLSIYLKEYDNAEISKAILEKEYNLFYKGCISQNILRAEE